jgi:hypothetical protein
MPYEKYTHIENAISWDVMPCGSCKNRHYVLEEYNASIIRVTGISELGTTTGVTSNRRKLQRNKYFFAACFGG